PGVRRPPIGTERLQRLGEGSEEQLALLSLLRGQWRAHEVIRPRQRAQKRRQRRGVVAVASSGKNPQRCRREAEARSAKAARSLPRGTLDVLLGPPELGLRLLFGVQVQPGLVMEGMVADLVPCRGERPEELPVL